MKFVKVCDIKFFMKSGNVVVADSVGTKATVTSGSQNVSKISDFHQYKAKNNLMLNVLDIAEIEAVVTFNHRWKFVW